MKEKLIENSSKIGEYIIKALKEMQEKNDMIGDVRGKGLFIGMELIKNKNKKPATKEAEEIRKKAYEKGLLVGLVGTYKQVLRLTPPLNITLEQADESLNIIESVFSQCIHE